MLHWFGNVEELSSHNVKSVFTVRSMGVKALSALAVAAVVAAGARAASANTITSPNWSGYALTSANNNNNAFTNVSATFVVPTVTPGTGTGLSEAAFWVGLDGYSSQRIEQIGVIAEAETGYTSYYYAFYATGAGAANGIAQVLPGDKISVAVSYNSSTDKYGLYIDDTSRPGINETITPTAGTNPAPSSAEWIAEAPANSTGTQFYPLANFGSVTFTSASATDSGPASGTISAFSNTEINLVPTSGLSANTGPLSTDGSSFTVTTVPEPAALGLMSVGGLAILFGRRKRR